MSVSQPILRGCGTRVKGGVYAETLLGPNGCPIECFIKDPPIVIDEVELGLSHVGVKVIEQNGVNYIFDWIGTSFYPEVTDFVEEVRKHGASRRLPSSLDWSLLSGQTKLVLIHDKASWPPTLEDKIARVSGGFPQMCPNAIKSIHHNSLGATPRHEGLCAAIWWADHEGEPADTEYIRERPSLTYRAVKREPRERQYLPAIFLVLPIHRISVVRDPEMKTHEKIFEKVSEKMTPVIPLGLVDE